MICEHKVINSIGTIEIPEPPELKNKDKNRDYKLRYAAKFNDLDNVKYQLKHGANMNSQDNNGKSALHEASSMGWTEIIETLIDAGADVNLKDNEGKIPLHYAVILMKKEAMELLVSKSCINALDNDNSTPLHYAATTDSLDYARFLIMNGADVALRNKNGHTPLDRAKEMFMHYSNHPIVEFLKKLTNVVADVRKKDGKKHDVMYFDGKELRPKREIIEAIAKEEDESNMSLTKSRLCAECRDEFKHKLCKKCGFCFCEKCFESHECIFDSHKEEKREEVSPVVEQEVKTEEITPMERLYRYIEIKKIKIGDNRRVTNEAKVKELAESIEEIGLLHPVTITRDRTLISGLHRIRAFELLNRTEIPYRIMLLTHLQAELAEIDENLIRNEIHYMDSGDYLARRKKIYEELYPKTKKGAVNQYTKVLKSESDDSNPPSSFVEDTAKRTGKSKTVIKEELQISTLIPEAKEVIKEKKLPKQKALKVARMDPSEQKKIMEEVKQGKDIDEVLGEEKPQIIPELKEILKEKKLRLSKRETEETARIKPEEQKQIAEQLKLGAEHILEALYCIHKPDIIDELRAEREKDREKDRQKQQEQVKEEPVPEEKTQTKKIYDPAKPYVPDTEEEAKIRRENSRCKLSECLKELIRMKEDYEIVKFFNFYKHAKCYFSNDKDFGKVAQAGHEIQKRLKEIYGYIEQIEEFKEILK